MDEQKIKSKELALNLLEKLLLENDFDTSKSLMLKVVTMSKQARQLNKPQQVIKALDELVKVVKDLTTDEIKELTKIIRTSKL